MVSKREIRKRVKKIKFGRAGRWSAKRQMGEQEAKRGGERRGMGEADRGETKE